MNSADQVGIVFANLLVSSGVYNGVVNATLAAYQFSPTPDGKIDADPVITCRLRLDKVCAKQLHERLTEILALIEKAESVPVGIATNGDARQPEEKLN